MLFLAPSMARVLDRPIRPILAALETKQILLNLARELERSQILTNFPEILSNFNKFSQKTWNCTKIYPNFVEVRENVIKIIEISMNVR